jgi:hypothetical protein
MMDRNIYYDPQRGGLCRLHSLNNYFGKLKISDEEFTQYMTDYNIEYKNRYNVDITCQNFDIVSSDQKNIIGYILKKHKIYTRYYAINQLYNKPAKIILNILDGDIFFIYNEGHIWNIKKYNDEYYSVNSIGGVNPININTILTQKNVGFIIPVNLKDEFYYSLKKIKEFFNEHTIEGIQSYLIKQHMEKNILGELEIHLGIVFDILGMDNNLTPIKQNVELYNEFLTKFTAGNYNDINLILEYLPNLISRLIKIST